MAFRPFYDRPWWKKFESTLERTSSLIASRSVAKPDWLDDIRRAPPIPVYKRVLPPNRIPIPEDALWKKLMMKRPVLQLEAWYPQDGALLQTRWAREQLRLMKTRRLSEDEAWIECEAKFGAELKEFEAKAKQLQGMGVEALASGIDYAANFKKRIHYITQKFEEKTRKNRLKKNYHPTEELEIRFHQLSNAKPISKVDKLIASKETLSSLAHEVRFLNRSASLGNDLPADMAEFRRHLLDQYPILQSLPNFLGHRKLADMSATAIQDFLDSFKIQGDWLPMAEWDEHATTLDLLTYCELKDEEASTGTPREESLASTPDFIRVWDAAKPPTPTQVTQWVMKRAKLAKRPTPMPPTILDYVGVPEDPAEPPLNPRMAVEMATYLNLSAQQRALYVKPSTAPRVTVLQPRIPRQPPPTPPPIAQGILASATPATGTTPA